jgi:hypothetical protein
MSLVDFLIFTLSSAGITLIVVLSYLLEPIRDFVSARSSFLGKLVSCTMCMGFWVGAVCSMWFDINPVFGAAVTSLVSWTTSSVVDTFSAVSLYIDSYLENGEQNERDVE